MTSNDPALTALLAHIATRPAQQRPDYVALADGLSSEPLAAFVRAMAAHHWTSDLGAFETVPEPLAGNGFEDEIREALESVGHGDAEVITLGNTGGGEETLLMVADASQPGGYVLHRFALDGSPYRDGQPIERIGQLGDFVRKAMADEDDVAPELLALVGETPAAPEPRKTTPVAPGAAVLRPVDAAPEVMTWEEKRDALRPVYDHTELRDKAKVLFRTTGGRIAAMLVGNLQGKYRREAILLDADGSVKAHGTDGEWSWVAAHPTEERALILQGETLSELDLDTLERVALDPAHQGFGAEYFVVDGREHVLTFDRDARVVRMRAHEPMKPLGDASLAEVACDGGDWYETELLGHGRILRPQGQGYELVRLRGATDVQIEVAPVVAPGVDDLATAQVSASKVGGETFIRTSEMREGRHGLEEDVELWFTLPD